MAERAPEEGDRYQSQKAKCPVSGSVGDRLKFVRQRVGLSQRELARRADVTNGTLSNIEQGKVSPSVQSLEKILSAIPVSMFDFFSDSLETSASVYKHQDFIEIARDKAQYRILPINDFSWVSAHLAHQTYQPGANISSEWMVSKGLIAGIVMSGTVLLTLDGVSHALEPGEGFSFSIMRPHVFRNESEHVCTIVAVSISE